MALQSLHCKEEMDVGELWLYKIMFSLGWVLTGNVPEVRNNKMRAKTKEMSTGMQNKAQPGRARSASLNSIGS